MNHHGKAPESTAPAKHSSPCHCEAPPPVDTCCELICFERPNYFCGHLLTDADLSLEQKYVREKNKLYHRSLHGHGVVCGLRLTCGSKHCTGTVRIDKGYAIDDCGNDLVVCEPQRFDVVARLREKGWLLPKPVPDPCEPEKQPPECKDHRCFYVTICYEEKQSDFTTPFAAGCRHKLSGCEPTRTQEGVRFDVLDELPKQKDWLRQLECRIEKCWRLFTESQFGKLLKTNAELLRKILCGEDWPREERFDPCELFCQLKGFLLLYLEKHPDQYNCRITKDISEINCPPENESDDYSEAIKDAFCKLLNLAYKSWASCVMGELIFPCAEPCEASCIVLGTVEIEDGELVRVCNCPRSYVWSFAHFFEVFTATILGGLACHAKSGEGDQEERDKREVCCRDFKVDCCCFMKLFEVDPQASGAASATPARVMRAVRDSLFQAFDFMQPGMSAASLLKGSQASAKLQDTLGITIESSDRPLPPLDPIETIVAAILQPNTRRRVAQVDENHVVRDIRPMSLREELIELQEEVKGLRKELEAVKGSTEVEKPPEETKGPQAGTQDAPQKPSKPSKKKGPK